MGNFQVYNCNFCNKIFPIDYDREYFYSINVDVHHEDKIETHLNQIFKLYLCKECAYKFTKELEKHCINDVNEKILTKKYASLYEKNKENLDRYTKIQKTK